MEFDLDQLASRICTDTRKLKEGDFYIPLKGPNFDGHNFIHEAIAKGAVGVMIEKGYPRPKGLKLVVEVEDTLKGLGDLAHRWRQKFSIPILGLTGSVGKTTTKEMLAACLSSLSPVLKTQGNLNNLIGVPLTLFNLNANHQVAVVEMGMNAFGEIARLTEIVNPTLALITNVGRAHLEGLGSVEGVAKAKGELFAGLSKEALALVNEDDPFISKMPTPARKLRYGFNHEAEIRGLGFEVMGEGMKIEIATPQGKNIFKVPAVGEHYAKNFLACYAACYALGVKPQDVQKGVDTFKVQGKRGEVYQLKNGAVLIDDCYNANPESMIAAFKNLTLTHPRRRKMVLLGDMFELGPESPALHREVGREAALLNIDCLFAEGEHARDYVEEFLKEPGKVGKNFSNQEELGSYVLKELGSNDVLLVKGSRGAHLEKLVEFIRVNRG